MNTNFENIGTDTQYGFTVTAPLNGNKHLIQYGNITSGVGSSGTITFGTPYTKFVQVIITGTTTLQSSQYSRDLYPSGKTFTNFSYNSVLYSGSSVQWIAIGR